MGAEGLNKEIHKAHYSIFPEDFTEPLSHDEEQIEMFEGEDLGTAPIERSEPVAQTVPENEGFWTGEGVIDIRQVRGEAPPSSNKENKTEDEEVDEQLDLPGVFESNDIDETEPKVVEWREPAEKVLPTGSEGVKPQAESVSKTSEVDMTTRPEESRSRKESFVQPDKIKNMASVLGSKGREFFQNMPDNAKKLASSMYDGIYTIPGVNRVAAKAEIAWNQVWIDRKQDRVIELNDKVREISAEATVLGESESALSEALETIRAAGFGSTAKIEKSLRQIASRKSELSEKKATFESKVSRKQESMTSFVEKRNEITDRMVGKYTERVKPLEAKMENLGGLQDALEFQTAIMEADHAEKMIEIGKLEEKRTKVYDALRTAGLLDKKGNHPNLSQFDSVINASKMRIAFDEAVVKAKERDIKERIEKVKSKAQVYKDKGAEFSAIKNRALYIPETPVATEESLEDSSISTEFRDEEHLAENSRLTIGTFLDKWNEHLNDIADVKQKAALTIDKDAFLKGARWNDSKELDLEHFTKVLDGYYRMKKVDFRDKEKISASFKDSKLDNK